MTDALILRPDTRYECHGDGTCCTTIHLLGPITKSEAKAVRKGAPRALGGSKCKVVVFHAGIEELVLNTDNHRCVFLDEDARCRLHAHVGEAEKPAVCRHFPVGSAATPAGMRITLSHRCPCVSIGGGAPLDQERARSILGQGNSRRISPDYEVGRRIRWCGRKSIKFDDYLVWESEMLKQLDGPDPQPEIKHVLGIDADEQMPPLRKSSWNAMGKRMLDWTLDEDEEDGFFCTVRWASLELRKSSSPWRAPLRPWGWTLDRTAKRVAEPVSVRKIFGAWLADWLWSLSWSSDGSVYCALADMTARYALAQRLTKRLKNLGTREDLAAAEAIMIVDTVGASDPWGWVRKRLVEAP